MRPIPQEIFDSVEAGTMPLSVFADWLEEDGYPDADAFRKLADICNTVPELIEWAMHEGIKGAISRSAAETIALICQGA